MSAAEALERALEFLEREQLPTGQFPMEYTILADASAPREFPSTVSEKSPFVSSCIAHSLRYCPTEGATKMVDRVATFLEGEANSAGLWRYWCKDAPLHAQIPPDADDTASISALLSDLGRKAPDNKGLLLANRDTRGLFYTWFIPRITSRADARWWNTVLGDITWGRAVTFWRAGARRDDIDPVVNANVVLYLGQSESTRPAIQWLLRVAQDGDCGGADKWYRSAPAFYYAVSRCAARNVESLRPAGENARKRYAALSHSDGRIGGDVLQTAMAVCSLMNFGCPPDAYEAALDFVISAQDSDGGFASCPMYFDGRPSPRIAWGSRAGTTGFCVEALARHAKGSA